MPCVGENNRKYKRCVYTSSCNTALWSTVVGYYMAANIAMVRFFALLFQVLFAIIQYYVEASNYKCYQCFTVHSSSRIELDGYRIHKPVLARIYNH